MTTTTDRLTEGNGTELNAVSLDAPPETEQQRQQRVIAALNQLANENGYQIGAEPHFSPEGRTLARWGLIPIG